MSNEYFQLVFLWALLINIAVICGELLEQSRSRNVRK